MQLTDILELGCVRVPLRAREKFQAITELIDLLKQNGALKDYDAVLKAVMERESVRSTGVGQGFAIPHGKTNAVDRLVMAVGKLPEPIDFVSIDKEPVTLVVLLISPTDQTGPHIQAIARITRLMTDPQAREKLHAAATSDELYHCIRDYEQQSPA